MKLLRSSLRLFLRVRQDTFESPFGRFPRTNIPKARIERTSDQKVFTDLFCQRFVICQKRNPVFSSACNFANIDFGFIAFFSRIKVSFYFFISDCKVGMFRKIPILCIRVHLRFFDTCSRLSVYDFFEKINGLCLNSNLQKGSRVRSKENSFSRTSVRRNRIFGPPWV
ncbi:hypothetical protein DQM68_09675 [Leptospira mayottensis]|uniref:Uncharacterized protein n=2 Tax=Leptospira mayottensis TaxID=1137606 RepID=A0AA87SW99_9LEPT|nr:hypothetical protein DQM68_09675 [Leptospira mayottensis]AXR64785.1 hypothetical protein DQM28_11715 [Leptospira mayottensis]AZQ03824.1 hypothetical protein LEP1GSC190_12020 [Leptospira mayottensis 200901116]EKR98923.1 hypothetical protein LEP1GSC125_2337 [Leptospira mayottensis 200901122]TGN12046.1 hypothetical protein EHR03_06160 [Leptospira mayottensis]